MCNGWNATRRSSGATATQGKIPFEVKMPPTTDASYGATGTRRLITSGGNGSVAVSADGTQQTSYELPRCDTTHLPGAPGGRLMGLPCP
jgi:hypothetical protein